MHSQRFPCLTPSQEAISSSSHICRAPVGTQISMGRSNGEVLVLAQSSLGSCSLLSPAPHFHYSTKGLLCPLAGAFALGSCQEQQKGLILLASIVTAWLLTHIHTCPQAFLSPDSFSRHTCAQQRREPPRFQERQTKLSKHLAPGRKVRPSTGRIEHWRLETNQSVLSILLYPSWA